MLDSWHTGTFFIPISLTHPSASGTKRLIVQGQTKNFG
jgi:hypothetical protein